MVSIEDGSNAETGIDALLVLLVVAGSKPALDESSECFDCASCSNALRATADSYTHVDTRSVACCVDSSGDVTVKQKPGVCTCCADVVDELRMAGPILDGHSDVSYRFAFGFG